jgi:integrase
LYGCTIRSFAKWLKYEPTIDDLTDLVLSRYLEHRASVRSPFTAEKERSQLVALWRFACDRGILKQRPEVPPSPLPERAPVAWSVDELQSLLKAARASRGFVGPVPMGVFFPALIAVLWETAERIGAVMQARYTDFDGATLLVRAEARKGGKRDRFYHLSPETCTMLAEAHAPGRPELLYWPRCQTSLWSKFGDVVARAGLGHGRRLRFHQLRRTAASHFAAAGGDAVKLLDHSSPRITHRWYLDRRLTDNGPRPCDLLPRIGLLPGGSPAP